ncbi:MAG TPA: hypothetical protein VMW87_12940 [Spirochaetia bacterium]|nr:hypothetical protein [Spirochaetia bacterium]
MRIAVKQIKFPEGDSQEIPHALHFNELVDINGYPISLPLSTTKIIAYRVCGISSTSTRNEEITEYALEIVRPAELFEFLG